MSGTLAKMNENFIRRLSPICADFFFSLRSLRLCGSLFSQEFPVSDPLIRCDENSE